MSDQSIPEWGSLFDALLELSEKTNAMHSVRLAGLSDQFAKHQCPTYRAWLWRRGDSMLSPGARRFPSNVPPEEQATALDVLAYLLKAAPDYLRSVPEEKHRELLEVIQDRLHALSRGQTPGKEPPKDGPTMEGLFFLDGKPHPFSNLQWRFLKALYGKGSVSIEAIGQEVYPGEDVIEGKIKKLKSDTEASILKQKLPFEINSPHACSLHFAEVTSGVTEK